MTEPITTQQLAALAAAVDAGAGSIMSSFNEIDGVPATGNKWLLTDLLRKQWGAGQPRLLPEGIARPSGRPRPRGSSPYSIRHAVAWS